MDRTMDCVADFSEWLPIRLYPQDGNWRVDWAWFSDRPLRKPFFHDEVHNALQHPFNQALRRDTDAATLLAWAAQRPGLTPRAFIHHASRCGSTLVAQMLAALDRHTVVSEAGAVDSVLKTQQPALIQALLSAYGQPRCQQEQALFFKLDAWHVFYSALLKTLYPTTPQIFIYRDPLEIAVSQLRQAGMHFIPGAFNPLLRYLGELPEEINDQPSFIAYCIARILEQGLATCQNHGALAVNYQELPHALSGRLAPVFGLTEADKPTLIQASLPHAKHPHHAFSADTEEKRSAASIRLRECIERYAQGPYQALEALRPRPLPGARSAAPTAT